MIKNNVFPAVCDFFFEFPIGIGWERRLFPRVIIPTRRLARHYIKEEIRYKRRAPVISANDNTRSVSRLLFF